MGIQGINYIREGVDKWTQVNLRKVITVEGSRRESERETDFQNKMGNNGSENGLTPEIYKASKI